MRTFLIGLLLTASVAAQNPDGIFVPPTGISDRGPLGGTSLVMDATRCSELERIWRDSGGNHVTLFEVYKSSTGTAFIAASSTATATLAQNAYNRTINLEPSGTPLRRSNSLAARLYQLAAEVSYRESRPLGNSAYALRNLYADVDATVANVTRKERIKAIIAVILEPKEPLD